MSLFSGAAVGSGARAAISGCAKAVGSGAASLLFAWEAEFSVTARVEYVVKVVETVITLQVTSSLAIVLYSPKETWFLHRRGGASRHRNTDKTAAISGGRDR